MKRLHYFILAAVAGALIGAVTGTNAEPIGNMATPINHLVVAKDLHAFGTGVYGGSTERSVSAEGYAGVRDLKSDEVMAYISYYPLNWLSAYVAAGYGRFELTGGRVGKGDWEGQWAFGARVNLLDHDVADPWIFEDRIRVSLNANYSMYDTDLGMRRSTEWSAFKSSALVSIVNDVVGNKLYLPSTVAIFAGPVYSVLGGDMDETEEFGFIAGLQAQLSAHTAFGIGFEDLDGTSVIAGLDVRF